MSSQRSFRVHCAVFGAAFAIACIVFLAVVKISGIGPEVVTVYLGYADKMMDGLMPYSDFDAEYPPFAFVFMLIPRLFASSMFGYEIAFAVEAFIFFMIGLWFSGKLAKKLGKNPYNLMLIYSVLMVLMLEFALDRYDIFPVVLVLASIYCFVTKRYIWACAILSVATMTKLYPALLFPIYMIPFLMDRDWRNMFRGIAVFLATAFAILIPFMLKDLSSVFVFLDYHLDRPLEIESTAGSVISAASLLGLTDISFGFDFGSNNIYGSWPDAVMPYLTPIMLVSVVAAYAGAIYSFVKLKRSGRDTEDNRLVLIGFAIFTVVMLFVVLGKVFSGQYMLWFVPFILLLMMLPIDHSVKRNILYLFILAEVLTQLNFLINYGLGDLTLGITGTGAAILLARNAVMILVTVVSAVGIWRHMCRIYRGTANGR